MDQQYTTGCEEAYPDVFNTPEHVNECFNTKAEPDVALYVSKQLLSIGSEQNNHVPVHVFHTGSLPNPEINTGAQTYDKTLLASECAGDNHFDYPKNSTTKSTTYYMIPMPATNAKTVDNQAASQNVPTTSLETNSKLMNEEYTTVKALEMNVPSSNQTSFDALNSEISHVCHKDPSVTQNIELGTEVSVEETQRETTVANENHEEEDSNDAIREKIALQLKSVGLDKINVNNLYKYISKEAVFKILQYGEKLGLVSCDPDTVQTLGWKIKQLRHLKKEITGVTESAKRGRRASRFTKKRKSRPITVSQARKLAKKRLKGCDDDLDSELSSALDKNALARALDLRVNRITNQDNSLEEEEIDEVPGLTEDDNAVTTKTRRGRKCKPKSYVEDYSDEDADVLKRKPARNERKPRSRPNSETTKISDTDSRENEQVETENESTNPKTENESRARRVTYPNLTVSPSTKSKKKIKIMINKLETIGLNELTSKNLYQFISKSQTTEYLDYGRRFQFLDYDTLKQAASWRLEQLQTLQGKLIEYNLKVKQHEAEYKRMRRADPEYRERERQRNKEAKRKLRQDPEYRKQELINMTRARQLAKFRKLQLEFIEQEELMIERRAKEVSEGRNLDLDMESPSVQTEGVVESNNNTLECEPEPVCEQPHESTAFHQNDGVGHFNMLGHQNQNSIITSTSNGNHLPLQIPVHQMAPKEFTDNENEHHHRHEQLKDNANIATGNYQQTRNESQCVLMPPLTAPMMHRVQSHDLIVPHDHLPPQNAYVNRDSMTQLIVPMHLANRQMQDHRVVMNQNNQAHNVIMNHNEATHRAVMDHNDYTCLNRENVYHEMVQNNKFTNRHDSHSAMTDHNVSFTSLLINDQLLDCELQQNHE